MNKIERDTPSPSTAMPTFGGTTLEELTAAPKLKLGTVTTDAELFRKLWEDTPISGPKYLTRPEAEKLAPGTCVKTYAQSFAELVCGRVHKNPMTERELPSDLTCVVIGHGMDCTPRGEFIWRGTFAEFKKVWQVD